MRSEPTGSDFAAALRRAISGRDLPLAEICRLAGDYGVQVSPATLSLWQSGRRTPRTKGSLRIVGALEDVLEVPPDSLRRFVSIPVRAGRPLGRPVLDDLPAAPAEVNEALSELGMRGVHEFDDVSAQALLEVGPDRMPASLTLTKVVRANRDGARRTLALGYAGEPVEQVPRLIPVAGFTIGRRIERPGSGLFAAEIILPAPVRRNETAVIELRIENPLYDGPNPGSYGYVVPGRTAQVVLMVRFAPGCDPDGGEAFLLDREGREHDHTPQRPLAGLHHVAHDFGPGAVGLRWWWDGVLGP